MAGEFGWPVELPKSDHAGKQVEPGRAGAGSTFPKHGCFSFVVSADGPGDVDLSRPQTLPENAFSALFLVSDEEIPKRPYGPKYCSVL